MDQDKLKMYCADLCTMYEDMRDEYVSIEFPFRTRPQLHILWRLLRDIFPDAEYRREKFSEPAGHYPERWTTTQFGCDFFALLTQADIDKEEVLGR